ncbi:hypothetical protein JXD38_09970, partial [candidate division WOR-3 bacterium]|nr:hypothetical protein [candidate division WOR-3 bacterium]
NSGIWLELPRGSAPGARAEAREFPDAHARGAGDGPAARVWTRSLSSFLELPIRGEGRASGTRVRMPDVAT